MSEYDPATCITAGEVRAMGGELASDIPDCAWTPKSSVRIGKMTAVEANGTTLYCKAEITFHAPWTWVDMTLEIKP